MMDLKITLKRSYIGVPKKLKKTLEALGLRKIGMYKIRKDIPAVRGMIHKVSHLLQVEQVGE
ncbi:MAG: 50S ribosomal protein L30 [Candidatus Magnetoovum sp. WYHC-5]|nr:50S ribosomal protein L30 [Candidatus Magnetoovum sp. WYHC-5]